MIKIKKAEHKFQRCNACYKKDVKAITLKPEDNNHSQTFHLCDDCLSILSKKIEKIKTRELTSIKRWTVKIEKQKDII